MKSTRGILQSNPRALAVTTQGPFIPVFKGRTILTRRQKELLRPAFGQFEQTTQGILRWA